MIIGISGKAQSGKDTIAQLIQAHSKQNWKIHKFATKVREICSILTGEPICNWDKIEFKNSIMPKIWHNSNPITYRQFMQQIGTDAIRAIYKNAWVNALFNSYNPKFNWIISDVRFENEANRIKQLNGFLIRVERHTPTILNSSRHISETELDDYSNFDTVINNNFSINNLENIVIKLINKYKW